VGDDNTKSLFILDSEGRMLRQVPLDNVPADVVESDQGLYVTCVGSYIPSEIYRAALVFLEKKGDDFGEPKVILKELPRSVQAEFGDFNEDGRMDFALCMFGNLTGRFSWYENLGQGEYREHVLSDKTGAIRCVAYDFNRDGHLDLALLMAQHFEMLILLYNDGRGNFTGNMVLQRPPPWGHNYFELADFNQDGRMDLLVVNGDNGEYQSPLKRYHGVRIYLNQGDDQFEEAYFYPINGAYKAIARDYDQDGDLDIAVISYFPDYRPIGGSPRESFVYLENQGGLKFTAHTYRECIAGRWMVMDAADLDGDGDLDLVLGSYILGPSPLPIPEPLMETWRRVGPSVQILRNTLK
jgi:hypothetical protein